MPTFVLSLTDAGLAAVQGASGSDPTVIAELGLTATPFIAAPTITALPGEFKRVASVAGIPAAPNITHITAYDTSADVWTATGLGLYLSDGTLFAVFDGDGPILSKAGLAFALLAFDIVFEADLAASIAFGEAIFDNPPATEEMRGIAELASQAETDAGADDLRIVTPLKLKNRLDALWTATTGAIAAAISNYALKAVTIIGGGLVTGGGDLSANRTLTVTEASAAEITTGASTSTVVTPRRLGPISMLLAQNGYIRFFSIQIVWGRFTASANATTAVTFPLAFANACASVVVSGAVNTGVDSKDNLPAVIASTISTTGFSAFSADDEADVTCYIGLGY